MMEPTEVNANRFACIPGGLMLLGDEDDSAAAHVRVFAGNPWP